MHPQKAFVSSKDDKRDRENSGDPTTFRFTFMLAEIHLEFSTCFENALYDSALLEVLDHS
ncbi:hypothetical protein JT359_18385 [Candidatus Poribacteria bacterium]|nr:hypothetical protein [Candidatus Poribacteria bacterium]